MIEVGDIVQPKKEYVGKDMLFYVTEKDSLSRSFKIGKPLNSGYIWYYKDANWYENEVKVIVSKSELDVFLKFNGMSRDQLEQHLLEEHLGETKEEPKVETVTLNVDKLRPITNLTTNANSDFFNAFNIDSDGVTFSFSCPDNDWIKSFCETEELNKEEEYNMIDILRLYKERKNKEISKKYNEKEDEIKRQDTILSIYKEMKDQINALRGDEECSYDPYEPSPTEETQIKIKKLDSDKHKEYDELNKTIEEVEALFEMTQDYEERMKILKKYGIINKDGKLSI